MPDPFAVTWWGHSSLSVELGDRVVATDPLLTSSVWHLRRLAPSPPPQAAHADLVLVSHLHRDHLHVPSLDRIDRDVPVVVPRGAPAVVRGLGRRRLVEVDVGDELEVAGVRIQVLPAHHDGRRSPFEKAWAPAVGFRFDRGDRSVWYPGDTGVRADVTEVDPVDLAAVPIGGWGPSLGEEHLDPQQAADAATAVGARWALAVHYGTFWPVTTRRNHVHRHFYVTPPERFRAALAGSGTEALTPAHAERLDLSGPQRARETRPSSQTGPSDS